MPNTRSNKKQKIKESVAHIIPITVATDTPDLIELDDKPNMPDTLEVSSDEMNCDPAPDDSRVTLMPEIIKEDENVDAELPARPFANLNLPEKIIVVYDSALDEISTNFIVDSQCVTPDDMLKRCLRLFLYNKSMIDSRHQFALVHLNSNDIVWVKDFSTNIELFVKALDKIKTCETEDIIALDKLFDLIASKINFDFSNSNRTEPPRFIVRTIFLYGRSFTMPTLEMTPSVKTILQSPYFTFDVIMTHEVENSNNNCQKIIQFLKNIDLKGFSYFLPVGRNNMELYLAMVKICAHPLQRATQKKANYSMNIDGFKKETV